MDGGARYPETIEFFFWIRHQTVKLEPLRKHIHFGRWKNEEKKKNDKKRGSEAISWPETGFHSMVYDSIDINKDNENGAIFDIIEEI